MHMFMYRYVCTSNVRLVSTPVPSLCPDALQENVLKKQAALTLGARHVRRQELFFKFAGGSPPWKRFNAAKIEANLRSLPVCAHSKFMFRGTGGLQSWQAGWNRGHVQVVKQFWLKQAFKRACPAPRPLLYINGFKRPRAMECPPFRSLCWLGSGPPFESTNIDVQESCQVYVYLRQKVSCLVKPRCTLGHALHQDPQRYVPRDCMATRERACSGNMSLKGGRVASTPPQEVVHIII